MSQNPVREPSRPGCRPGARLLRVASGDLATSPAGRVLALIRRERNRAGRAGPEGAGCVS